MAEDWATLASSWSLWRETIPDPHDYMITRCFVIDHLAILAENMQQQHQIHPDNWDDYLNAFRTRFAELNSTDPYRFPKGEKSECSTSLFNSLDPSGAGYWCLFPANEVYGKFTCDDPSHGQAYAWTSRQVNVDIKVTRTNFIYDPIFYTKILMISSVTTLP